MFIIVWFVLAILMAIVWLLYKRSRNASVIDVCWSLGIAIAGLGFFVIYGATSVRSLLILILLIAWAARLSAFLYWTRIRKRQHDKRYQQLSQNWRRPDWGFFWNYQLQGVLMVLMALPFIWSTQVVNWHWYDLVAGLLVVGGIVAESIADYQLLCFKASSKSSGVMQQGLWRYSRHPNYFFESCVWLGFAVFALAAPWGWLGLIAPLLLLSIMLGITLPMTEKQSLDSRGDAFRNYQRRTSMFVPWWPKR